MPDPALTATNDGFTGGQRCRLCGAPTGTVSVVCMNCVASRLLAEELDYAAEVLAKDGRQRIEMARDHQQRRHLVLFRTPDRGWCGIAHLAEPRPTRVRTPAGMFPPGICGECLEAFERAIEEVARGHHQAAE